MPEGLEKVPAHGMTPSEEMLDAFREVTQRIACGASVNRACGPQSETDVPRLCSTTFYELVYGSTVCAQLYMDAVKARAGGGLDFIRDRLERLDLGVVDAKKAGAYVALEKLWADQVRWEQERMLPAIFAITHKIELSKAEQKLAALTVEELRELLTADPATMMEALGLSEVK